MFFRVEYKDRHGNDVDVDQIDRDQDGAIELFRSRSASLPTAVTIRVEVDRGNGMEFYGSYPAHWARQP
jgi:hypothetical protein